MKSDAIPSGAIKTFPWNKVPSGWRFELLGNVASIRRGSSPRPAGDPRYFGGTIPWFKIGDATRSGSRFLSTTEEFVNEEGAKCSVRIPPGSLIVANSGVSLGFAVIPEIEGCIHDGWLLLNNFSGAERDFLYYCINHFTPRIRQMADGTTQPNLNTDIARKFLIPLPPLPEQRAIASMLGALDNKVELNGRVNETQEALAQTLFKSWFVDATKDGLPKGWSEATLRDLASNIQYGLTQSASNEAVGPRLLRITDIQGGRVDWGNVPYCKVSDEEYRRYRLKANDIVVARTGASTGENIYLPAVPDAVFASYLVRFQFADPAMARFVGAFMRTPAYFDFVAGCIGGSAQPNASAQALAGAKLAVPPPDLVRRFSEIVAPFDRRIFANNEESRTLTALRDELLPKLLAGEIRVVK